MDLAEVLDATEPVECKFLNHKITAHVYTAGAMRLTKEQRAILRSVDQASEETVEIGDDADEKLTRQISDQVYNRNVDLSRTILPVMIGSWDLDGDPMTLKGEPFPPTEENMPRCPDALVIEVALKAVDVWKRPMNGGLLPNGSPQAEAESTEKSEPNQTETITP